jgi:large subunit ribosomal protein LP0
LAAQPCLAIFLNSFVKNCPLSTIRMVKGKNRQQWKNEYFQKTEQLFSTYSRIFIVDADHVSSKQFQEIRRGLRGHGDILMGKNTLMKKAIRRLLSDQPELEKLLPHIRTNVGFVLTSGDLKEIRDVIISYKVQAPARAGAISNVDVKVPPQHTALGPEKTSFFQALSIPTKISRGAIEITGEVHLLRPGEKVGQSECALLNMLKISPFTYGLDVIHAYDSGFVFAPDILDITENEIRRRFVRSVENVAAVSLEIGYPTMASVPHSIANAFGNLMALAAASHIEFAQVETMKAYLNDPAAFGDVPEDGGSDYLGESSSDYSDDDCYGFSKFD